MSLEELKANIQKKAKGTHVSILSQSEIATSTDNIPTPAYDLNRILSGSLFRGIPNRTFTLFVGPEASGKSSIICLCLAEAQRKGYTPIIIDTEGSWNELFVKRWGMDPDNILYIYTPWISEIQVILGQIIASGDKKIALALDSIGALETLKLVDDSLIGDVKADQGQLAKNIKRAMKMLQNIAINQESIIFGAGHYYGNPSQYGSAEKIGGGFYMRLAPHIILSLKKSKLFENGDKKKIIGNDVKVITLKNKLYPPFQEATLEIDYRNGINSYAGILDLAIKAELAEITSPGRYIINGQKYHGGVAAQEGLREDKTILDKLDKWLETTGYSTINENIAEAEKILVKEMDKIEEEIEKPVVAKEKPVEAKKKKPKITSKPTKGKGKK